MQRHKSHQFLSSQTLHVGSPAHPSALISEHALEVTLNILVPKCGLASVFALVSPFHWNLVLPGIWSLDLKPLLIFFFSFERHVWGGVNLIRFLHGDPV